MAPTCLQQWELPIFPLQDKVMKGRPGFSGSDIQSLWETTSDLPGTPTTGNSGPCGKPPQTHCPASAGVNLWRTGRYSGHDFSLCWLSVSQTILILYILHIFSFKSAHLWSLCVYQSQLPVFEWCWTSSHTELHIEGSQYLEHDSETESHKHP